MTNTCDVRRLMQIRDELIDIADREAMKLFRLARRAKAHGCRDETIEQIRSEARELYMISYPERLLDPFRTWKYAFK